MKLRTFILLMAAVLLFIWGHSLIPRSQSAEESLGMMIFLQKILDFLHIPLQLTDHLVRKLAHFAEHAVAGIILGCYFFPEARDAVSRKEKIVKAAIPFAAGLFIGFIDETVQLFSGRGAAVADVWIDFAGICCGAAVTGLVIFVIYTINKRKNA
ncbi:MAG TPA: hypothetical protein DDX72_02440 [Ruminococcaceae bacterium]|nr:hypothetical protein [Oscillospiraceae bacterium]